MCVKDDEQRRYQTLELETPRNTLILTKEAKSDTQNLAVNKFWFKVYKIIYELKKYRNLPFISKILNVTKEDWIKSYLKESFLFSVNMINPSEHMKHKYTNFTLNPKTTRKLKAFLK